MWLMDQPLMIVFGGVVLSAALLGGLFQTGKKSLGYATICVSLLTIAMLGLERVTVTPREAVIATLHIIAHELEQNDVAALVNHISEGRPKLRAEAEQKMGFVEIIDVDIKRNLKVVVLNERGMDIAEARFNAVIRLRPLRGFSDEMRPVPRFFVVRFKKEDGKWRVRDYEMADPRQGIGT